ncbi:MAG: DUF1659 domain-containing protein [Paraclostridium sp.]
MAESIVEIKNASSLRMRFDCGLDNDGKSITKSRTYSNVKPTALPLDIYNVADALASLQKHSVLEVLKQDSTTLAE